MDCSTAKNQVDWVGALVKAAKRHELLETRAAATKEQAAMLGISPDTVLTVRVVSKAYRKLCLKVNDMLTIPTITHQ